MRGCFSFLFYALFLVYGSAHAGPLEALSEQAYKLTGKKCTPVAESNPKDPACESTSDSLKKSSQELGNLSRSLTANDEDRYFVLLAEQQVLELQCAGDFALNSANNIDKTFESSGLKAKLAMARLTKQKAQQLGKKIASDPALATPVCPQTYEALEGQYPKGATKGAGYKACKEWIGYRTSYQAIVSSIPLSAAPGIKSAIENFTNSVNEVPEDQIKKDLSQGYSAAHRILDSNAQTLSRTLKTSGAEGLDRAARNELLADPALSTSILKSNPKFEDVACHANARYGEGADNLNNSVMVGSLVMGGGSALLGKVGAATFRAFETSALARATGKVSLVGMKVLKTAALGTDFASMAAVTHQACFSEKLSELKTANACVSAPTAEQVEKDNCILAASLLAIGAVPQGMVNELASHIKTRIATEKAKATLTTEPWLSITPTTPDSPVASPVTPSAPSAPAAIAQNTVKAPLYATPLEKQLAEGKIVARQHVGEGVFGAQFVRYDNGMEGVWKQADNSMVANSANNEVAAYAVDRYLGLKSVPVTVKKEFNGKEGTVQYRVKDLKKISSSKDYVADPSELGFFDYLIANGDRHGRNYLQKTDGKVVAIDHGLAFDTGRSREPIAHFNNRVDSLERNLKKQAEITQKISQSKGRLESLKQELRDLKDDASELQMSINAFVPQQSVVDKLRRTTAEDWRRVVGDNLNDKQIEALQKRQMILLRDIDDAEKRIGKDRLYPGGDSSPLLKTMKSYDN